MTERDPKCVFATDDPRVAEVVADTLGHHGIAAEVINRATFSGLFGSTAWSSISVSRPGLEVWVHDPKDAPAALQLLAEYEQRKLQTDAVKEALGPVEAVCEECGQKTAFDGRYRGTVQDCPHCHAYMDVPGDDEPFDWSVPDNATD
jgi:hypothetical protein